MLWKKESSNPNALYTDLFVNIPQKSIEISLNVSNANILLKKNDEISIRKRNEGNELFGKAKWAEAIEKYNESLCFAPNDSENISLAYANRASCFLRLKLYKECLIDIDLARQAGYPKRLMSKLDQRESDCLKHIEDNTTQFEEFNQKLSFDPDENFPCMANILKIQQNQMGKLSVIAKEDIDVGKTIVFGKAFLVCLYNRFAWKCNICLKDNTNLMPCKRCSRAMFCSDECQQNSLHEFECGQQFHGIPFQDRSFANEIRALMMAMNIFTNVDELMNFVDEAIKCDPKEMPTSMKDDRSKYKVFLRLPTSKQFSQQEMFSFIPCCIYKTCLRVNKINQMFKSMKHRRFLMHLISHHVQITNFNSYCVNTQSSDTFYYQLGLMQRIFNHSCAPNVSMGEHDGISIYTTIRPIKEGEELFTSYFKFLLEPKQVRQRALLIDAEINCQCTRCMGQLASSKQRQHMASDSKFQSILSDVSMFNLYDIKKNLSTMQKCVDFLQKYGRMEWCDEIGEVIAAYMKIMHEQIKRPMTD